MNGEKQKKIRTQLINFMNQELMNIKKSKKSNFLINSMTLEQLEKKNMQCKDFYIEEKNEIYQNIDNGWVIGLNIYINNIAVNNPLIYSLENIIKNNTFLKEIKNKNQLNINCYNTKYIETIIQKQSNKVLYIQKEGNVGSPVDTSLLIKKELGERILKQSKKEFNSNKMPIVHSERFLNDVNFEKEKAKIINSKTDSKNKNNISKKKINDIEELKVSKQLSNITLETEISRIIQLCHEERYINSFEHYPSDTKISNDSKEIKRAKIYAKKLKLYCRTLKRKFPLNNNNEKNFKIRRNYNDETKIKKEIFITENKIEKSKKIKKISSYGILNDVKKLKEKIKDENDDKQIFPKKKIKSERNIKLKIKIKSKDEGNKNNIATSSSNNKQYKTLDDKINKKRISLFKLKKKTKRKTLNEEIKSKNKFKLKKFLIKSIKLIKIRNKRLTQIHKTINDTRLLTDSPKLSTSNLHKKKRKKEKEKEITKNKIYTDPNKENKENNLKKLIKNRGNLGETNKNEKSTNISLVKDKKQRTSHFTKINLHGFEKLNFLKIKHKSTCENFLFDKKIKKNTIIRNRIKNNTTITQQKDSSPSISLDKKLIRKNKNKNNTDITNNRKEEKKKTFGFLKRKKASVVIEALKKMKKRKSTNYEEKTLKSKRRLSLIYNENLKENNSKKVTKINNKKFNSEETKENEIDNFNLMDEYLYRKKHERCGKM